MRIAEILNGGNVSLAFGTAPFVAEKIRGETVGRMLLVLTSEDTMEAVIHQSSIDPYGVAEELLRVLDSEQIVLHGN